MSPTKFLQATGAESHWDSGKLHTRPTSVIPWERRGSWGIYPPKPVGPRGVDSLSFLDHHADGHRYVLEFWRMPAGKQMQRVAIELQLAGSGPGNNLPPIAVTLIEPLLVLYR